MIGIFRALFKIKSASKHITILDVVSYKEAISKGKVQLVDVRTANEYNSGHINNALNFDIFNKSKFKQSVENLDKQQPVYVYCKSGMRSQSAAKLLESLGFQEIIDLKGGYVAWSKH